MKMQSAYTNLLGSWITFPESPVLVNQTEISCDKQIMMLLAKADIYIYVFDGDSRK